jgi:phenylpyruvate tautomerase PptA (4-oxalocrotonate tautomerase family)
MPVIFVEDTQKRPVPKVRKMIRAVNKAVSETLGLPPNTVWVRYEPGRPEYYGEGADGKVPKDWRPVFVVARMTEGRDAKQVQKLYGPISSAIAKSFDMFPDFVWIRIEEFSSDKVGQGAHSYTEIRKQKKR